MSSLSLLIITGFHSNKSGLISCGRPSIKQRNHEYQEIPGLGIKGKMRVRILMKWDKGRTLPEIAGRCGEPPDGNGARISPNIRGLLLTLLLFAVLGGCKSSLPEWTPMKYAPPASGKVWKAPPDARPESLPSEELAGIPPELQPEASKLTLVQLVDVALRTNPSTRQAWEQARAAAADWAIARGSYYPTLEATATGVGGRLPQTAGLSSFRGVYGEVGLSLSYLLLDFGGRAARVEAAHQALTAANWNHNQIIQDVLRNVPQAYYTYLGNKALVRADEINLEEAETSLRATEMRRMAGVSTIADVLQARANMEGVRFNLVSDRGSVEIARGRLATAVGWPANQTFDVAEEPEDLPLDKIDQNTKKLIELAQQERPELTAARAAVKQREAELRETEAALWPKLMATGNVGVSGVDGKIDIGDINASQSNYYGGLQLQIPIFEGMALRNAVKKARANLEAARSALRLKQEIVIADVWDAYHNFRTAAQQLETSESLVASSKQSYDVSLARYKAGAADIVELLNAQSTLAKARAQRVKARTSLYTSYAELLHAIGSELPVNTSAKSTGSTGEGGNT
jgi:outer membrane protein